MTLTRLRGCAGWFEVSLAHMPEDILSCCGGNGLLHTCDRYSLIYIYIFITATYVVSNLTLLLLDTAYPVLANSEAPDQLASEEAN